MTTKQHIVFTHQTIEYTGLILHEAPTHYIIKLTNGYHILFNKKDITITSTLPFSTPQSTSTSTLSPKTDKKILLIHTGGTIASKVDYTTGAVSSSITPDELFTMYPQLHAHAHYTAHFMTNIASENMNFTHYNELITIITERSHEFDGIIITHGTDTLHYTALALMFSLGTISIPVLLVGAQRSSDRPSSDGPLNLFAAQHVITDTTFTGVGVCMHQDIDDQHFAVFSPLNLRKNHSSRRDTFSCTNVSPLVTLSYDGIHFNMLTIKQPCHPHFTHSTTSYNSQLNIGMLYVHPNLSSHDLKHYTSYDALIIVGTGLGHLPLYSTLGNPQQHDLLDLLKTLTKKMPVIMSSQTIHGRINLQVYDTGIALQQAGVLGHQYAFTPETLFILTAYILSAYPKNDFLKYFEKFATTLQEYTHEPISPKNHQY